MLFGQRFRRMVHSAIRGALGNLSEKYCEFAAGGNNALG